MDISAGKLWGLRRLADPGGRFKMVAVDQRPPIMNLIKERRGVAEASYDDVAEVKALLTRVLGAEASAMLLDPIWAYPRAWPELRPANGLVVTLEDHRFEETPDGRFSRPIPDWSVAKIRRMGGDAVKVLAWYRPDAAEAVRRHQQEFVEAVGRACADHDVPFVFELLVYPLPGDAHQTRDYVEHAAKRPELVLESVRTFADPRYGVDLFKLESPVAAADVPDPDAPGAADCQRWFDELGRAAGRPWVMLSAGAGMAEFERILTYAYRAGASGYLAGRAIWAESFRHFPDLARVEAELEGAALAYMRRLNGLTDRTARPWTEALGTPPRLAGAGPDFPALYPAPGGLGAAKGG